MKFKIKNKGLITQGVGENLNPLYASQGLSGHTGVDWTRGFGSLVTVDNGGYVYKVYKPQERPDNWVGVYILVPDGERFVEVCMGHLSRVFVSEGQTLLEGQFIGKEGNFGTVYSAGTQITPEMQDAGDRRGSHVHESWRPVIRVKKKKAKKHYLDGKEGSYRDAEGYYYEVINTNNLSGCINPLPFSYYDTVSDTLRCISNALKTINYLT